MLPKDYTQQEKMVSRCLDDLGLRYETQADFGKYRVDFYVPELGWVIEADGLYGHLKKSDEKRDRELIETYGVKKVVHLKAQTQSGLEVELAGQLFNG